MSKFGQMFELLLLPEFTMDLTETYIDETMDIDHQTSAARIREFVVCSPAISKCEQFFESLLLNEFTMDLSETHSNATMDIGPQSNMAGIWNLFSVILLPNLTLSTVVTSSLELYILRPYSGALATHWSPCIMRVVADGQSIT